MITSAVLQLARNQFGVVHRRQLLELGISDAAVSRARRKHLIADVTGRTIRLRSTPESFLLRCKAVDLHLDGRGFVAAQTAGRLYGLRGMSDTPIRVTIPQGDRGRLPRWAVVSSSSWFDASRDRVELKNGLTVAEPHRMLYGLAAALQQQNAFERAAQDAWHLDLVTPRSAAAYLAEHRRRGKNGTRRMHVWLDKALNEKRPAESGLELDMLDALAKIGLPTPERQHPLRLHDGRTIHVDIAWPEIRLCVEPGHSWWHGGDDGFRIDIDRKLAASAIGWDTIALDESLRLDPALAAQQVAAAYRARAELFRSAQRSARLAPAAS